jgi:hypothetical protein
VHTSTSRVPPNLTVAAPMPRTQSRPTKSEPDFRFKHSGEAEEHPSAKVSARGDGSFSYGLHAAIADGHEKVAEDTKPAAADVKRKKKVKRSKERWANGGFGYDFRAEMAALQDRDVEGAKGVVEEVAK